MDEAILDYCLKGVLLKIQFFKNPRLFLQRTSEKLFEKRHDCSLKSSMIFFKSKVILGKFAWKFTKIPWQNLEKIILKVPTNVLWKDPWKSDLKIISTIITQIIHGKGPLKIILKTLKIIAGKGLSKACYILYF